MRCSKQTKANKNALWFVPWQCDIFIINNAMILMHFSLGSTVCFYYIKLCCV